MKYEQLIAQSIFHPPKAIFLAQLASKKVLCFITSETNVLFFKHLSVIHLSMEGMPVFQGFHHSALISPYVKWRTMDRSLSLPVYIGGTGVINLCPLRRQKAFPHHIFATTVIYIGMFCIFVCVLVCTTLSCVIAQLFSLPLSGGIWCGVRRTPVFLCLWPLMQGCCSLGK